MRNASLPKKQEDSICQIVNSYMNEVKLMAFELVFSDIKEVRLTKPSKSQNSKMDQNRLKNCRSKLKKQDIEKIIDANFKKTSELIISIFQNNDFYDFQTQTNCWKPSAYTFDKLKNDYYENLIDFKKNKLIKLREITQNKENIELLKEKQRKRMIEGLNPSVGIYKTKDGCPHLELNKLSSELRSYFCEVGMSSDCKSFAYLKFDAKKKDIRSLDFINSGFGEIRKLDASDNK